MTPTRLRECLEAAWWTQRGLARILDRQEGIVRGWARGSGQIPPDVAAWLEAIAQHHQRNPPPMRQPAAPLRAS